MALLSVRAIIDPSPMEYHATIEQSLNLQSHASACGQSSTTNFLVVQTEADFDLIVDEIWANMKKDKNGWNSKAELRAGLLAFMQSLPGN